MTKPLTRPSRAVPGGRLSATALAALMLGAVLAGAKDPKDPKEPKVKDDPKAAAPATYYVATDAASA